MATSYSRHSIHHGPPKKTLPIIMPSKAPAYPHPVSRVAMSPPEYSDASTYSPTGSRHSGGSYSARSSSSRASTHSADYESNYRDGRHDVSDMLSERMNSAFDPIRMDKSLAKQAQE